MLPEYLSKHFCSHFSRESASLRGLEASLFLNFVESRDMLKPLQLFCLGGVGLLAIGACLSAGGEDTRPAADLGKLIAEQKTKPASPKEGARAAASDAGWVGTMLEEVPGEGVRVVNVFPGGPAAFAGLRTGDVLVKIGETSANSLSVATGAIEKLAPGKQTTLSVKRKGKAFDLKVTAGSLNEFHARYTAEMLRRDPRDPNFHHQHGVSEADMSVELVRRLFEQNHRLELKLQAVLDEVQALRKEVRESRK